MKSTPQEAHNHGVFILQSILLLILLIGYGTFQMRRSAELRNQMSQLSRGFRGGVAAALMFGGAVILLLGLFLVQQNGGSAKDGFHWWAFAAIAVIGLVFVRMQTFAAAMMVSLVQESVTTRPRPTSTMVEHDPRDTDANSP